MIYCIKRADLIFIHFKWVTVLEVKLKRIFGHLNRAWIWKDGNLEDVWH